MLQLMRKHARNWLMKVVLGIIIIVFVFYFGSMRGRQETETIAIIDGARIAHAQFRDEYQNLFEFYRERYGDRLTDDLLKQINLKEQAFDSVITQAIMLAKADEWNLRVSDNELQASILSYPAFQRDGAFNNDLYQRILRYQRMTPETFEEMQRKALATGKVERLIRESAKVSEQEVYEVYRLQNRKVNIRFIRIPTEPAKSAGKPSEEEILAYFQEHKEEFRMPQTATIEYIRFDGERFAGAAHIADDEIEEYYRYHEEEFTENGTVKPLPKVRDEIVSRLKSIRGMDMAFKEATTAHDTIYQEENFEEYAEKQGHTIQTTSFPRNAPLSGEFAGMQELGEYVFDLQEGDLGRVFSGTSGHYVFRLVSLKPSRVPELTEVLETVKKSYAESRAIEKAREKAERINSGLRDGTDMTALSRKEGLTVSQTGLFQPGPEIPKIGYSPEMEDAIFEISVKEPTPDRVFFVDGNYFVISLVEEATPDEKEWAANKEAMKAALLQLKGEAAFLAWLGETRERMMNAGRLKILKTVEDL